jgi:hypothetical protein
VADRAAEEVVVEVEESATRSPRLGKGASPCRVAGGRPHACERLARVLLHREAEATIMPNSNATPRSEKSPLAHTVRPPASSKLSENEGEGSRSAARNYDKATEKYVKSGRVEAAAKKAKAAVEGPEGDELRKAELATRATVPEGAPPGKPDEESFVEPELMKDESEDRE